MHRGARLAAAPVRMTEDQAERAGPALPSNTCRTRIVTCPSETQDLDLGDGR
jgi:hypothetical protein